MANRDGYRGNDVEFQIVDKLRGDEPVLEVLGDVDVHTAPQLRDRLNRLIDDTAGDVVVDLTNVDFMDSTGLGVLVGALTRIRSRSATRTVRLICTKPAMLKVFEITGMTKLFELES